MAGADTWPARLILMDATAPPTPALAQLLDLIDQHPGATGTSVVLAGSNATVRGHHHRAHRNRPSPAPARRPRPRRRRTHPRRSARLRRPARRRAQTCETNQCPSTTPPPRGGAPSPTTRAPCAPSTPTRGTPRPSSYPSQRPRSCTPRTRSTWRHAATTTDDLATLAPAVPASVRDALHDADPTLDSDLAPGTPTTAPCRDSRCSAPWAPAPAERPSPNARPT